MTDLRVSVVMPAYNESEQIVPALERLTDAITLDHEILVVVDSPEDLTIQAMDAESHRFPSARILVQDYGRGPANAIRFGIDAADANCVVVTMADGCDDVQLIDDLVRLVERGCAVAAASRYMAGGAQIGGPRIKKWMSRSAGLSLHLLAGVGTRDATNSFKAYDTDFVRDVGLQSRAGFEIAIELVAKAHRLRRPIAEIPTIWLDRSSGESNFHIRKWLPDYLRWYRFAYGPQLTLAQLRSRTSVSPKAET